jgi:hypothetical protein
MMSALLSDFWYRCVAVCNDAKQDTSQLQAHLAKVRGEHVKGYIPFWHPDEKQWISYRTVELYIAAVDAWNLA